MKFNLTRPFMISMVFLVLSLGSAVYVVAAIINYDRLYPALARLTPAITKITVVKGTTPIQTILLAHVMITNPSDYSGLDVYQVSVGLSKPVSNTTNTFLGAGDYPQGNAVLRRSLPAHTSLEADVGIPISAQNATYIYNQDRSTINQLFVQAHASFDIVTWLDPVVGRIPEETTRELSLSL